MTSEKYPFNNGLHEEFDNKIERESNQDGFYYFDIETVFLDHYMNEPMASLNPSMCKIISIQYQYLNYRTGKPNQDLTILKEWEYGSNEKAIIQWLYRKYIENKSKWYFIPVGNNLEFEFRILNFKLCQYFGQKAALDFTENKPKLDVKDALIMMNGCRFKDYSSIIGKSHKAKEIALWYTNKNYEAIEEYIIEEAENFVNAYSVMLREFSKVRKMLPPIVQAMENPTPMN